MTVMGRMEPSRHLLLVKLRIAIPAVVVLVAACASPAPAPRVTTAEPAITRPTMTDSPISTPAASGVADARWIVYQSGTEPQGRTQLHLVHPDGSDDHPLIPGSVPADQSHPSWSPDGELVAFDSFTEQAEGPAKVDLWTVRADGSDAKLVVSCTEPCLQAAYPAWSPDGRRIAFTAYDIRSDFTWGRSHLQVLDVDSGEITEILTSDGGKTAYYTPRWSPDGESLVFVIQTYTDESEETTLTSFVAIIDSIPGGEPRRVTPADLLAQEPDWAPSDRILFSTAVDINDWSESARVAVIDADGSNLEYLTEIGPYTSIEPTWLSGGGVMFVSGQSGSGSHISWLTQSGSEPTIADWALLTPTSGVQRSHAHLQPPVESSN